MRVSTVTKSISMSIQTMTIRSIESISICLWFSISRSLTIISMPGISQTISMVKGRVTMSDTMTISKGISTMSKTMSIQTMIAITMIQSISIGFGFRISFTICNISTSTGIGTVDSRYSSRSNTMDTNSVGNIGYTITNCMVDRNSMSNMVYRSSMSNMVDRSGMSNMVDRSSMSNMVNRGSIS